MNKRAQGRSRYAELLSGRLRDRVAVVGGAAGQVGEGIVAALLTAGARVYAPARSMRRLDDLRRRLERSLGDVELERLRPIEAEAGTPAGAIDLRDRILAAESRVDTVVASLGGWWQGASLVDLDEARWLQIMASNLTSHWSFARAFLPPLSSHAESSRALGAYTFITGPGAARPVPGAGPISAAGAAVRMMTQVLRLEMATSPLRINEIMPFAVMTADRAGNGAIDQDDVGALAALVAANLRSRNENIELRSPEQVADYAHSKASSE